MDMEQRVIMLWDILGGENEASVNNGGDISDAWGMLQTYLQIAGQAILNKMYPYTDANMPSDVPPKYQMLQVEIAAYMINKRGAEGETQHIENGIHRNYHNAYIPDDMLRPIVPHVGLF